MKQLINLIVTPKVFLLYALICISGVVLGSVPSHPIYVSKAGDGWDLKIDSAIILIKNIDSVKYSRLLHVCTNVDFWAGTFSSNDGIKTILVSVNDVKLNSVNNLAAILIHESMHLYVSQNNIQMTLSEEECQCYMYEFEFLTKLKNLEPWLLQHTIKQIQIYSK
jgi:hypothetical protein